MIRDLLGTLNSGKRLLIAVAADAEAKAVAGGLGHTSAIAEWTPQEVYGRVDLVRTGIGKANAAGAVGALLASGRYGGVLNLGIAGSLPGGPGLGAWVAADSHVMADEGVRTPAGFVTCDAIGFPLADFAGSAVPGHGAWVAVLRRFCAVSGAVATVSACSGTDQQAAEVARRTGAIAEGMEGAAAALVARRMGAAYGEARVISNTTGDRAAQRWELGAALAGLWDLARVGL